MLENVKKKFDPNIIIPQLRGLQRGQSMTYYIGDLSFDRARDADLNLIANLALSLCQQGDLVLVQRRVAESCFEYIAQSTRD
jgi:hypothetical protein